MKKSLILDSGALINFSMNNLLDLFYELKKIFGGNFLITEMVMEETIRRPLNIKKYELGALMIQKLLKDKIIELPSSLKIENYKIEDRAREILNIANKTFYAKQKPLHLIDMGEASCLALSEILDAKNIKNMLVVDERTTRMLCENPNNLQKLLRNKLHTKIKAIKDNFSFFYKFKIIRSSELAYIAHKKKLVDLKDSRTLDALLYAIKYKGCSISREEIEEMKSL